MFRHGCGITLRRKGRTRASHLHVISSLRVTSHAQECSPYLQTGLGGNFRTAPAACHWTVAGRTETRRDLLLGWHAETEPRHMPSFADLDDTVRPCLSSEQTEHILENTVCITSRATNPWLQGRPKTTISHGVSLSFVFLGRKLSLSLLPPASHIAQNPKMYLSCDTSGMATVSAGARDGAR